ncbi:MAG: class II fumarate hydratase [Rickettsiales bacterium]|nr:class II fumarate hydratase [Rickettsiales bacterium]|tara:strand:- start:3496 stop:5022 length:1527 start_codon:yes stop_codon:yes gene_type:complete
MQNKKDNTRIETDSMGQINVPIDSHYGAQTGRSIKNFPICPNNPGHKMPIEMIMAMILVKKSAALANKEIMSFDKDAKNFQKYSPQIATQIIDSCDQILQNINHYYDNHFPLVVWQTGSGTQTNMNCNEVIASIANEKANNIKGGKSPIHPNDHVNLGQSSNDTFPTAMHVCSVLLIYNKLMPTLIRFYNELKDKELKFSDIVKIGRTHTQDATPLTLGQEFSGYKQQILNNILRLNNSVQDLMYLAQGGTAVGTGLNSHKLFAEKFAEKISEISNISDIIQNNNKQTKPIIDTKNSDRINNIDHFLTSPNKFESLASCDSLIELSGTLNTIATSIMKIANDIRFLASGPRSGLGEVILPENEPGSSIMPGKVNPTQCEALTMISCQVIGNHSAVTIGGSNGHFELNVFRPMIIFNIINSINLLSDGINSFIDQCLIGIKPNLDRINKLLEQSLMLVTALNPHIGYDNAAKIAKTAHIDNTTLKEAAIKLNLVSEDDFDKWVNPKKMI